MGNFFNSLFYAGPSNELILQIKQHPNSCQYPLSIINYLDFCQVYFSEDKKIEAASAGGKSRGGGDWGPG